MRQTPPALEKRRNPGKVRAIILAVVVHAAFFGLIVFGVTWQSQPSAPLQAELWDKLPPANAAAPAKPEPERAVEPPKPEPPRPVEPPRPAPPRPEPPKPEAKPDPPKPDAAIAERKEREKREKLERVEKQKQEEAAKKKREQDDLAKKKREDEKRKQDEDRARRETEKAREAAAAAAIAARSSESEKFINAIKGKIRSKANVPDNVTGRPALQVRIRILPGGDVLEATVVRSSGNRAYDAAIERAILSAQPLPVPAADSELFPQFRDLILNIEHDR